MASVEDIKAVSYDVCGVVRMISTDTKAMVNFVLFSCLFAFFNFYL
jgi:hypothetical protein